MEVYVVKFQLMHMYSQDTENTMLLWISKAFGSDHCANVGTAAQGTSRADFHKGSSPPRAAQNWDLCWNPWFSFSGLFQPSSPLMWVELVILLPLSPLSCVALPLIWNLQWSAAQGGGSQESADPGCITSPGAGRWQGKPKPCALTPFLLPITSGGHARSPSWQCSSSHHGTLAWMHLLDRMTMQLLKSWKEFI